MSFSEPVLAPWLLWLGAVISFCVLMLAMRRRPWRALLADRGLQHRWLGATLAVVLLWQLRAQAVDWLSFQLMFTALMTLVFKAPLALVSNVFANLSMALLGRDAWPLLGVTVLVTGVVPVLIIGLIWRLVDRRMPDHLMVFLFVGAFFGSALTALGSGLTAVGLMALGASEPQVMHQALEYARFLPLLMPAEAFITGMLMSILMVYHPGWVATFNDHRYIDTK